MATSGYDMELAEFLETLAVGLHCVGPDGTILRANRAELELLGYERDEYIGRPITDFHVDREVIDDILARLLRGETLRERPARMRRKDGTIREVLITSSGYFEAGRFVHSRCMTADVTELRRAQEAQAQLAAIVESSGDAILSKSLDGTILSWNQGAARLFGYGAAEAVGQNIRLIVPPERESEEQAILERLRRGEAVRFETVRIAKDRRRIDVSVTTSPVRDQQGKVIAASKIARDITEQKRSAETLGALLRISEKLNSTLDVDTLLDILVQEAMALVGARAGAASLYIPEGILTRSYGEAEAAESVTTPIVAADQTVLGFFEVHRQGVTEADRQKLAAVSYPAAIAIQNAVAYSRLQQAEERFARFMQHLPGLAWIKDLNGRYIYANDAAERAFRTPREKLYGRTDDELFPPETAAQFRRNDQRAATSETGIRTVEILEHEDGPHHSLVHKFPIPGPDGRTVLVGGMAIDFTDRIRTEEALRASEQRYRAVLESQAEMVCRFRPDGTILFVNGAYARTLGTTPEELANRNFWDFVSAEDRDGVRAMLDRLTPENPQIQIENRFESHDGTRWTLWTNRALAFDRDGRVVEAQSAGIDITDRKRVEEALRRANADLEQFAYSASHDLQEPIRNIAVFSEILAQRYGHLLDARGLEHLGFVQAGARRMEALVRDLMTYTQVANPDEEPGGAGNAAEALEMALGNLSAAIRESGAEVTSDRLPEVGLPEVLLQQLFQNLVSNAIKYRRDGEPPRIHVGVRRRGAEWLFLVRDNGIGIAAEYHQRVFGIFKRLHGDGKYAGTGIGLAICQRIVERQGGRIWVESEGTGKGSTFCFTVPALTGT